MRLAFFKTFVLLSETHSFTETATRLGLSQSTVSDQIRKLEAYLGVGLFDRSAHSGELTRDGLAMLGHARSLLRAEERMLAEARGTPVTIGCSNNIASYFLVEALQRAATVSSAALAWKLRVATNPEVAEGLRLGEIDLAAMEWPDPDPELEAVPWRTEPLVVILPADHPLADRESLTVDEVLSLDIIGGEPGSGTGTVLRAVLGPVAEQLRIARSLPSTEAVKSAVRAGLGASIVLAKAVEADVAAGRLVTKSIAGVDLAKHFHLMRRSNTPESSRASQIVQALQASAAEISGPAGTKQ